MGWPNDPKYVDLHPQIGWTPHGVTINRMNRIPCQSKRIGQIPAYSNKSYDHWKSLETYIDLNWDTYIKVYINKGEQTFATLKLSHWWKVISNKVQPCTNIRYIRDDHQYWKLRKQWNKKVHRLCVQSTRQITNVVEKQAQSNGVFFCNRI